jgi:hypothetical protein
MIRTGRCPTPEGHNREMPLRQIAWIAIVGAAAGIIGCNVGGNYTVGGTLTGLSGQFVYAANDNSADISVYSASAGVLTPVGGGPFAAGSQPRSIAID